MGNHGGPCLSRHPPLSGGMAELFLDVVCLTQNWGLSAEFSAPRERTHGKGMHQIPAALGGPRVQVNPASSGHPRASSACIKPRDLASLRRNFRVSDVKCQARFWECRETQHSPGVLGFC